MTCKAYINHLRMNSQVVFLLLSGFFKKILKKSANHIRLDHMYFDVRDSELELNLFLILIFLFMYYADNQLFS